MNCPDWRPLLAHRFDADLEPPASWPEARDHLEGCHSCRREALAIDPTLAFRGAATWTSKPNESADILQAVSTLRRAAELGNGAESALRSRLRAPSRERGPLAAAALFALILAFQPSTIARNSLEPSAGAERPAAIGLRPAARLTAPAIEGVDRPSARVYEWGADDLSVVMVVDESLDV